MCGTSNFGLATCGWWLSYWLLLTGLSCCKSLAHCHGMYAVPPFQSERLCDLPTQMPLLPEPFPGFGRTLLGCASLTSLPKDILTIALWLCLPNVLEAPQGAGTNSFHL